MFFLYYDFMSGIYSHLRSWVMPLGHIEIFFNMSSSALCIYCKIIENIVTYGNSSGENVAAIRIDISVSVLNVVILHRGCLILIQLSNLSYNGRNSEGYLTGCHIVNLNVCTRSIAFQYSQNFQSRFRPCPFSRPIYGPSLSTARVDRSPRDNFILSKLNLTDRKINYFIKFNVKRYRLVNFGNFSIRQSRVI